MHGPSEKKNTKTLKKYKKYRCSCSTKNRNSVYKLNRENMFIKSVESVAPQSPGRTLNMINCLNSYNLQTFIGEVYFQ